MPEDGSAQRLLGHRSWLGTSDRLVPSRAAAPSDTDKRVTGIAAAFDASEVDHGQTFSFHHHYRNGDLALNAVLEEAARRGLRDLTIAASSIFPVHAPLANHMRRGTVTRLVSSYVAGPVAEAIMAGVLDTPVLLQSHGGRARALSSGVLAVDVAFVGAPTATPEGTTTGRTEHSACGPLGYAMVDAAFARRCVVIAPGSAPAALTDIPAAHVDHVVAGLAAGDAHGIASGTTHPSQSALAQELARSVTNVIRASGHLREDLNFQTGAGGYSLACVPMIGAALQDAGLRAGTLYGGITGAHVALMETGHAKRIRDVQCFDQAAVASSFNTPAHLAMSAAEYASPLHPHPAVEDLDVVILGAAELDSAFNVNVARTGDGRLIGGPGGHPDTAAGADLTVIVTTLAARGWPKLVDAVSCITTPGQDVDVVVTEAGVAVNPRRPDLSDRLRAAGLATVPITALIAQARSQTQARPRPRQGLVRALIEHRQGRLLDAIVTS